MTILRTYPTGWSVGEKLTSGQQNAIDIALTTAADKRSGQTDTIAAAWTLSGVMAFTGSFVGFTGSSVGFTGPSVTLGPAVPINDAGSADLNINSICFFNNTAQFAGPVTLSYDSKIDNGVSFSIYGYPTVLRTASGGRIVLDDSDYPQLGASHAGSTVKRSAPLDSGAFIGDSSTTDAFFPGGQGSVYKIVFSGTGHAAFPPSSVDTSATGGIAKSLYASIQECLIDNATITNVRVYLSTPASHGALPSIMPRVVVFSTPIGSLSISRLHSGNSVLDTAANVSDYMAAHYVDVSCTTANVVDLANNMYIVRVMNENGANAEDGLVILGIQVTMTVTEIRP